MEKIKLKYIGVAPTRVSPEKNSAKIEVKEGDIVEIEKSSAKSILTAYKGTWILAEDSKSEDESNGKEDSQPKKKAKK